MSPSSARPPRIVCSALGTAGDINPLLGLCSALDRRGFDTLMLTNEKFEPHARSLGVEFVATGTLAEYRAAYDGDVWNRQNDEAMRRHIVDYHCPARLREHALLESIYQADPNLVVVSLGHSLGATLAAERLGIPWINVALTTVAPEARTPDTVYFHEQHLLEKPLGRLRLRANRFFDEYHRLTKTVGTPYNALRRAFDEPPQTLLAAQSGRASLSLLMLPEWFACLEGEAGLSATPVGFPLYDRVEEDSRARLQEFISAHGAPIVFTPGSAVPSRRDYLRTALAVCKTLDRPCVLLTPGWRAVAAELPKNALGCDYVDLECLLAQALAIVHHGGVGTLAQAIRAGIPQLICPAQFDQFENAYRVWRLGLGAYLFQESFSVENCCKLLSSMIQKAPAMQSLRDHAARVRGQSGVEAGADAIVRHLSKLGYPEAEPRGDTERSVGRRTMARTRAPMGASRSARVRPFFSVLLELEQSDVDALLAVDSVLQQDFDNYELHIVVTGEADVIKSALDEREVHYVVSPRPGALRERVLHEARGTWIAVVRGNEELTRNFLRLHYSRLANAPKAVAATWCRGGFIARNAQGTDSSFHAVEGRLRVASARSERERLAGVCLRRSALLSCSTARTLFQEGNIEHSVRALLARAQRGVAGANLGVLRRERPRQR